MSTTTKKPQVPTDRIFLQGEARERIQRWTEELNQTFKGLRLTKTDLVSHFILSRPAELSAEDAKKVRDAYFDEVSFAAWVLREMKAAQKRGESTSLEELLGSAISPKRATKKKPKADPPLNEEPQFEAGPGEPREGGDSL